MFKVLECHMILKQIPFLRIFRHKNADANFLGNFHDRDSLEKIWKLAYNCIGEGNRKISVGVYNNRLISEKSEEKKKWIGIMYFMSYYYVMLLVSFFHQYNANFPSIFLLFQFIISEGIVLVFHLKPHLLCSSNMNLEQCCFL